MRLQGRMVDVVVVGQLVAGRLCQILDRHARCDEKLDGVVEPAGRDGRLDACDIAADGHHVHLILTPGPEPGAAREAVDTGKRILQRHAMGVDILFGDAGQMGEVWIERIPLAEAVDGPDVGLVRAKDRKLAFESELDGSDLRNDRIGIVGRAPKSALRAFEAKKFTVEYDCGLHGRRSPRSWSFGLNTLRRGPTSSL